MNFVPKGWQLVCLGDVVDVNQEQWEPDDSNILYLDLTSVVAPGILSAPREISGDNAPSRARRQVKIGDVLVSTVRPNLRGFARVTEAPQNLIASTGFAVLTSKQDVNASLIYHHVMTPTFASYLESSMTGQAYPAVRPSDVVAFPILLPPLAEQRAIAAVLDSIDAAIERTDDVIAATQRLRDSLLHELLTRGVPGWHSSWKDAPGLGTIPASWEVVRLGDVAEANASSWDPEEDNDILYLDLTAVSSPGVLAEPRRLTASEAPSRARRRVKRGDILISTVRPNLRGFARVVGDRPDLVASTGFTVLTPRACVSGSFLYHHVMSQRFASYLDAATTGQAYPAVRPSDVTRFSMPLPPLEEQQSISGMLDAVDDAIDRAREERSGLQALKASASEALLTGRVRVGVGIG